MSRVLELAQAYGLPPDLFEKQIMAESSGNPRAVSPKGAMGMGQLMPATARMYNVTDPFDPEQNLRASANYMADLVKQYNGNYSAALAHYNGGTRSGKAVAAGGQAPYAETRNYLNKIQGGNMDLYNNQLPADPNAVMPKQPANALFNPLDTQVKRSMLPNALEYATMNANKVDRLPLAMAAMLSGDKSLARLGGALYEDGNAAQQPNKLSAYMSLNPDGSILQVGDQAKANSLAKGKQLPFSAIKEMSGKDSSVAILDDLATTFKDNFAGITPISELGQIENWAARRLPSLGMQEQGNWWQRYNEHANQIRNDLFGSALTLTEKKAFESAMIDPGMDPAMIRQRLFQQQTAAATAYNKLMDATQESGYDTSGFQPRVPLNPTGATKPTVRPAAPAAPAPAVAVPGEINYDAQGRRIK
jgi:hypothetical protein